jgi:hypothetical protein
VTLIAVMFGFGLAATIAVARTLVSFRSPSA